MHHARQKTEERAGEEKGRRRQLFMRNDKMNLNMRNVSPSRCLFLSHNKCKKGQKLKLIKINESHTSDRRENTGSRGGQRCSCRKVRGMEKGGLQKGVRCLVSFCPPSTRLFRQAFVQLCQLLGR